MTKKYTYYVQVEELHPPLGSNKFAAKVPHIVKNPGPNFERIYPHFHEWWGITRAEAEGKAKAEAEAWIAQQQDSESDQ